MLVGALGVVPAAAQVAVVTVLDSAGNVGAGSSLAYGPGGLALVAYLDTGNGRLKVAACQDVACTSAAIHTLDASGTVAGSTAVAFGTDGLGVISYQDASGTVKVAHCDDAACATAQITPIGPGDAHPGGTAIVVPPDGRPLVVYGAAGLVRVARCGDAACTTSSTASSPFGAFGNPTAVVASDGRVTFASDGSGDIAIRHCDDASCATATVATIASQPPPGAFFVSDPWLALQPDGLPAVAYTYMHQSGTVTHIERCADAGCAVRSGPGVFGAGLFVNPALTELPDARHLVAHVGGDPRALRVSRCVAPPCSGSQTFAIDAAGIGVHPAIALGPAGLPLVSYQDETNADLKVAYVGGGVELAISSVTVTEGNAGLTTAAFEVTLSESANATVQYQTEAVAGSAQPGIDFLPASGTLTFTPGTLSQVVRVGVVGDLEVEVDERFLVRLSNATGAGIVDDTGTGNILDDDSAAPAARRELAHGSVYFGNLAAGPGPTATADYFDLLQAPDASYEIVADAVSGDLVNLQLALRNSGDTFDVEDGEPVGVGPSVSMRWRNFTNPVQNEKVRVTGACAAACGPDDVYRLRVYETTLRSARFNNSGAQTTLVVLQNPGGSSVDARILFWSAAGSLLAAHDVSPRIPPKGVIVLNTAQIAGLAGQSGTITVMHEAPYGVLVGKVVALETGTGFSFDTPLEPRPR
jgi:hypothetical protein